MPDFLTNLAEGIIDPQGFVAQRRQDRDMDSYLRAVGAQQNQQAPPQQAAPQQQQMPTPFHMERLAGQFPANEGQIVPTLMQGRPAVLPASLPSAPDDPWKKAEVAKHEQSIGMIQQDQSLNPQQKMHAISRIGEQMDALDPQRQYRRSSPGAQMTRGERFVAENVVPRYHPQTGEYMGDLILDGKGGGTFHQHKPEKDTEQPYYKRYEDAHKLLTVKDADGVTHHPSPQEVHDFIAASQQAGAGVQPPQPALSTGIQGGFGIAPVQSATGPRAALSNKLQQSAERLQELKAQHDHARESELRKRYGELRTKPVTEGSDLEKKIRYRSHDEAMKLMQEEDDAIAKLTGRTHPAASVGEEQAQPRQPMQLPPPPVPPPPAARQQAPPTQQAAASPGATLASALPSLSPAQLNPQNIPVPSMWNKGLNSSMPTLGFGGGKQPANVEPYRQRIAAAQERRAKRVPGNNDPDPAARRVLEQEIADRGEFTPQKIGTHGFAHQYRRITDMIDKLRE